MRVSGKNKIGRSVLQPKEEKKISFQKKAFFNDLKKKNKF